MDYKQIIAKTKLTNHYPCVLPNSNNVILTSQNSVVMDEFSLASGEMFRAEIPINFNETILSDKPVSIVRATRQNFVTTGFLVDIYSQVITCKNNDSIRMLSIEGSRICYVTKHFINVVFSGNRGYCTLILFDIGTLALVKRFDGVKKSRVPKYEWGTSQKLGLKVVGYKTVC